MIYTYAYDTTYPGPAMPVVEIQINQIGKETDSVVVQALVDSGADGSILPIRYLRQINARRVDTRRMRGVSGVSYAVDIYEVRVQLGPILLPKVYAVANRSNDETILGRDVLNHLVVTLNGLASVVEVSM